MTKQKHQAPQDKQAAQAAQSAQSAESRLDEALEESFPASDPIAVDMTEPSHSTPEAEPSEAKKPH
ncbi:hypothetical protein [Paraburkholderia sp. RL17-337-BIB-A]|jgi:hypothetical protein|uniref:hypothetical protein n=1 Tax=Paraburkholderia sp. RL17-337-BIB-A TaxID=3031636 RepID=UPI0038B7B585